MKIDDDFEAWENDHYLIENQDWVGLVKLRKERAEKNPNDLYCQWRYGEALIYNKEFDKALRFLTSIYKIDPYYLDVIQSILDALYGLERTENDFNWVEKPEILRLDDKTKRICEDFLRTKKKPIPFLSLYEYLIIGFDYLKFQEKALYEYLIIDESFELDNHKEFWEADIKFIQKK